MSIRDDFDFAWKSLYKSPGFAAVAIVTLALGIGLNAAIFSIVNAVLLKPLNLPNPDELVFVNGEMQVRNVEYFPMSPPDWRDLNEAADLLTGVAAYNTFPNTLKSDEGETEQVTAAGITNNLGLGSPCTGNLLVYPVYRVPDTVGVKEGSGLLRGRKMVVAPNPFNNNALVHWTLERDADVSLQVFDASGRVVRTLASGRTTAGTYTTAWNGRDDTGRELARGIYFVRLKTPSEMIKTKTILAR